jgi:hypothetical protein
MAMGVTATSESNEDMYLESDMPSQLTAAYTQQVTNMANVEFEIDLKYSIPSDGKSHMVSIMEEDISSTYKHYVVPKMDQEAFLVARMSGWEDLNLLPGSANVYFMNTFVGSTYIDPNTIEDTLNVPLIYRPYGEGDDALQIKLDAESLTKVRIEEAITKTMSLIKTIIKRDQIELVVNIEKDLPLVYCNDQQIQQVIINIMTNQLLRRGSEQRIIQHCPFS